MGARMVLKPVFLGGVFRAHGVVQNLVGTLSSAKAKHNMEDLVRWVDRFQVFLNFFVGHLNKTVTVLRCVFAVGELFMFFSYRFFVVYW